MPKVRPVRGAASLVPARGHAVSLAAVLVFAVGGCGGSSGGGGDADSEHMAGASGSTSSSGGSVGTGGTPGSGGSLATPGSGGTPGIGGNGSGGTSGSGGTLGTGGNGSGGTLGSGGGGAELCDSGALRDASWRDLGALPDGVRDSDTTPVIVHDGRIYVGAQDGVWQRRRSGGGWSRAGLEGKPIVSLLSPAGSAGYLMAGRKARPFEPLLEPAFFRSENPSSGWTNTGAELGYQDGGNTSYDVAYHMVRDSAGRIYANMSGPAIAMSSDQGKTWDYVHLDRWQASSPCFLHILPGQPSQLYQGCEAPLDSAWIARHRIDATSGQLGERSLLIEWDDESQGLRLSNRRINAFASSSQRPNRLYAGVEGGLLYLEGGRWEWVWVTRDGDDPYTYISAIWIDPCDPDHLVFGGAKNSPGNSEFDLFETFNHGGDSERIAPSGVSFSDARVQNGTATGPQGEDFIVTARLKEGENTKLHVFLREHR